MNRILLSFVCCTALISTVNVYSETSSADNQFQNYVTKQTYGPITTYETLWSVSNKLRPNKDVSVYQTLLAIYKTNPSAFLNGDINKIIINSVIDVPSTAFIAQQRNAEALKLLNIDPNKVSNLSLVKTPADSSTSDQANSEQLASEPTTQNTDQRPVGNTTTAAPTDAKYYLPDISDIQQARSQDEVEDTEQGMIYLSDLPSIHEKSESQDKIQERTSASANIEDASTTALLNEEDQTRVDSEQVVVSAEDDIPVDGQANLVEANTKALDTATEQTHLIKNEEALSADDQVDLPVDKDATNIDAQVDLTETEQTTEQKTELNNKEALVADGEQELDTDSSLEESAANIDEPVQSEQIIVPELVNENTTNSIDAGVDLNADDEASNKQSNAEASANTSETEQTTDSVAQALIEEMEVEQEDTNSLPAPFSEAEIQNQAQAEKTQSDIDKEIALLYEQLNTVTEANKILKQRLEPLSEQITLLSNQLSEDASVQDELQSLVEEYKEKIESFEQSPYSGKGSHNAIFRYITDSPIALISAFLVPLILLTAIFLFLLRRKNNQDSLQAEQANKSEIAESELDNFKDLDDLEDSDNLDNLDKFDDIDKFDTLLSELTVLQNDEDVSEEKVETTNNDIEGFVEKPIALSDIEEYLDSEDRLRSSKEDIDRHIIEASDAPETADQQSKAQDLEDQQQAEKVHSVTIADAQEVADEQEETNKKAVEENAQTAETENSKAEVAGGAQVVTDSLQDKASEAGGSNVVTTDEYQHEDKEVDESKDDIDAHQGKAQENTVEKHASSDENKTEQDYIEIDYLLSNNDGSEVSEEEFDLDFGLDEFPDVINATDFDTDADRISAQLDLARAYLEIDEKKNAKAILVKLLDADEDEDKLQEVHRLLKRIG